MKTLLFVTTVVVLTFLGDVNCVSMSCYVNIPTHDLPQSSGLPPAEGMDLYEKINCLNGESCKNIITEYANGTVDIEKGCVTVMQCQSDNGIDCDDKCTTVEAGGLKNTTCFCSTNLCNGSPILSVNYAIIGTFVLFYFLK